MWSAPADTRCATPAPSGAGRRRVRVSVGALCCLLIALGVSLVPYGANFEMDDANSVGVSVVKCEAMAVQDYEAPAYDFLSQSADAAGMTIPEYMLTCGIMLAADTGINLFRSTTDYQWAQNENTVVELVSTLEWPAWENLTESQQENYQNSKERYYAQQFNALMGCFGLADKRDVFYSSGGGQIDGETASIAGRIGDLGRQFASGAIVQAQEVFQLVTNPEVMLSNSGNSNFGLNLTKTVVYDGVGFRFMRATPGFGAGNGFNKASTSDNWYIFRQRQPGGDYIKYGITYMEWYFVWFSGDIMPKVNITIVEDSDYASVYTETAHGRIAGGVYGEGNSRPAGYRGMITNSAGQRPGDYYYADSWLNEDYVGGYAINGTTVEPDGGNYEQQMPETPEGLLDDENKPEGVGGTELGPGTTYPELTGTPSEPPYVPPSPSERPDNPYNPTNNDNPQNQSGTDEWKADTTQNMIPLQNIRFDRLFPFSMLYNLPKLVEKVQETAIVQAEGDYMSVRIPIKLPMREQAEMLVLDLTPLYNLLQMIRPFNLILLVSGLVLALIAFWRTILTG